MSAKNHLVRIVRNLAKRGSESDFNPYPTPRCWKCSARLFPGEDRVCADCKVLP